MYILQRTIKESIGVSGIGLHGGKEVNLTLNPAPVNTGIVFRRVDQTPIVELPISPNLVKETTLCTGLVNDQGVKIQTVEHLMAAIASFGIDNLYIDLNSPEVPIMDGSSASFVMLFLEAGVVNQEESKKFIRILKKVRVDVDDKFAELLPSDENNFNLDFTIDFNHPVFDNPDYNHYNMDLTTQNFIDQLSRARTFGFLRDIEYLRSNGLCLGGSLANAIVLDENRVINPEGLRFANEFVRHKMLDSIGDLFLCNHNIIGRYRAYKSGHALNNQLIRKLLATENAYEVITFKAGEEASEKVAVKERVNTFVKEGA